MITKIENANIGALSEFISLLSDIQNKFNGQTITISSIDSDNRDMYARINTNLNLIDLTLDYGNEVLSVKCFNEDNSDEIVSFIKDKLSKLK